MIFLSSVLVFPLLILNTKMISIIYPFKNRELNRVKKSLESLKGQNNSNFKVIFVDYGSDVYVSEGIKLLLKSYDFVSYVYSYNINQPWSRSKAINIGLKYVETDYVFIADIDIIFHSDFIELLCDLKNPFKSFYFQVGYLSQDEGGSLRKFEEYNIVSKSIPEGKGLSLFYKESLLSINGFDEFFHFWGAEDEDIHLRLQREGTESIFFNDKILLLHQWHPTFTSLNNNRLTKELLMFDVFNLNRQKLRFNRENGIVKANIDNWGRLFLFSEFEELLANDQCVEILNKKNNIDRFVNITLPYSHSKILNVKFVTNSHQNSFKFKVKKIFSKKYAAEYYSLKYINDLILLNVILHYKDYPYVFKVSHDLESIQFIIKK